MGEVRENEKSDSCLSHCRTLLLSQRLGCINTPNGGTETAIWECRVRA